MRESVYIDSEKVLLTVGTAPNAAHIQTSVEMKGRIRIAFHVILLQSGPDLIVHVKISRVMVDVIDVGVKFEAFRHRRIGFI